MRKLLTIIPVLMVTSCAYATPLDPVIPFKQGHYFETYIGRPVPPINGMYHSVSDQKLSKEIIKLRTIELQAQKALAQGESAILDPIAEKTSEGVWGLALVLAGGGGGAAGFLSGLLKKGPNHVTKKEADEREVTALHKDPPKA